MTGRLLLSLLLLLPVALVPADTGTKKKQALPPVIDPGTPSSLEKAGQLPSDAVVLFDGKSLDRWENTGKGKPVGWKVIDGALEVVGGAGSIRTKQPCGYGQYHIEFRTPAVVKGQGQGRGNSGVYLVGRHEIQVLDSFENETYPDGQCGAIYGQHIPLVNASRRPGVWQTFDIVFHPPLLDAQNKLVRKAACTVLHNGVLIHDFAEINETKPTLEGPLLLQDHGNPVRFRNLWYRPHRQPLKKK